MKKTIIISIAAVFLIFIVMVSIDIYSRKGRILKLSEGIDLYPDKIEFDKGVIIINDSIVIAGNAPQITHISSFIVSEKTPPLFSTNNNDYIPNLYDLEAPYKIIKKANVDTIIIIKEVDTLYFKFIDYEEKDPNDPTFSDLFNKK